MAGFGERDFPAAARTAPGRPIVVGVKLEQVESSEGLVLRSSPTPEEWQRTRTRLIGASIVSVVAGAALSLLELNLGVQVVFIVLMPLFFGIGWSLRFARTFLQAKPTAVVATDHSLRLERLDGSRSEDVDLGGISAIRIGPNGFAYPWRWLRGPRSGLVILRLRASGQGLAIHPQLASHPVTRQLLGRVLALSRARGQVSLVGPSAVTAELESIARSTAATAPTVPGPIGPVTVPAGWYHDPGGSGHARWWDGRGWAEHLKQLGDI